MNDTATQKGAARTESPKNPDLQKDEVESRPNPRNAALEAMAERQEAERRRELDEALEYDPGLRASHEAIEKQIRESNAEAGITHEEEVPSYGSDGAASLQKMYDDDPETPRQDLPQKLQDDPLADFIVMQGKEPMVKAKVNGEERLIPLADAKRQVQIGVAAEVRMQNAAQAEKMLSEREKRISAGEAALTARLKQLKSQPPVPAQPDLSDEELLQEAQDIFNTAFSGTEEDAAKKLAKTLAKIKQSAAARPTQQIDAKEIAKQAASMAVGTLAEQSRKKDVQKGYIDFKKNYPEIINDPKLFKLADDMTDTIEQEHPDWTVAQVMDEAGKRTQEWVKGLAGKKRDTQAPEQQDQNSHSATNTTQNRLERKQGLVRMPNPAAGAQYQEPEDSGDDVQSPQEAFLELKRARGQPV